MLFLTPDTNSMNRQPILDLLPTLFISTLLLGASASVLEAQEENRVIRIRPESGTIGKGSRITVYFTEAVVATNAIDRAGQEAPLLFDPEVAGAFLWKSQTEGQFLVTGSLIPDNATRYSSPRASSILTAAPLILPAGLTASFNPPN